VDAVGVDNWGGEAIVFGKGGETRWRHRHIQKGLDDDICLLTKLI
jgi:hypothetical protein